MQKNLWTASVDGEAKTVDTASEDQYFTSGITDIVKREMLGRAEGEIPVTK